MRDSRETSLKKAFVVGYPIKHSRSPLIHRHWLAQFGIVGDYQPIAVSPEEFGDFMIRLKTGESGYVGGNVTIPHKERAFEFCDEADALTRELGAANTLYLEDGILKATNTDGYGFVANLDQQCPGWDERRDNAVVLGAGGASRAIILALRDRGFRTIHVLNRTVARAKELTDRFGPQVVAAPLAALPERLNGADFFVNTTSLGMDDGASLDIDFSVMPTHGVVTDIVYVPLRTAILEKAASAGMRTIDGLGMLLHQAVPGFEKWFGRRPEVTDALRRLIVADLERHS
jgi:shikimate dehydrogenase